MKVKIDILRRLSNSSVGLVLSDLESIENFSINDLNSLIKDSLVSNIAETKLDKIKSKEKLFGHVRYTITKKGIDFLKTNEQL